MIRPISIVVPYILRDTDLYLWVQKRKSCDELNGLLEFPGGKIGKVESPEQAAVRETLEETGVNLEPHQLQKFKNYEFPIGDSDHLLLMVFVFQDIDEQFQQDGLILAQSLLSNLNQIPPNNKQIIVDLLEYFR